MKRPGSPGKSAVIAMAGLAIGLALQATSCATDDAASTPGGDGSTALPACTWDDGEVGECTAARVLLSCRRPDGVVQVCLGDDVDGCPAPSPSDPSAVCQSLCAPGEFAVSCGGVGPGAGVPPPEGCRAMEPTPGGVIRACCPCSIRP